MSTLRKVRITLNNGPFAGETLWAEPLGDNLYRLENIPVYANGYAYGDVVRCEEVDSFLEVKALVQDSGNGTIRIAFADPDSAEALSVLNDFSSLNCEYEKTGSKMVAISLPYDLEVPFSQMANYLNATNDVFVIGWEIGKRINRNRTLRLSM